MILILLNNMPLKIRRKKLFKKILKKIKKISEWTSKGLSDESITLNYK